VTVVNLSKSPVGSGDAARHTRRTVANQECINDGPSCFDTHERLGQGQVGISTSTVHVLNRKETNEIIRKVGSAVSLNQGSTSTKHTLVDESVLLDPSLRQAAVMGNDTTDGDRLGLSLTICLSPHETMVSVQIWASTQAVRLRSGVSE
jgi:hypothetical protein